jgi:hypothetical protein
MLQSPRSLLLGILLPIMLAGCGSSSVGSSEGAASAPASGVAAAPTGTTAPVTIDLGGSSPIAGSDDLIVATPSQSAVSVVVGASQTINITFASSDAKPMTGFAISAASGALPAGWSGPATFTCATVNTGSGCVLNLSYTPTAVAHGTLTINYVVVDNAGIPRTNGTASIAYAATSSNNIVAAASPTGQVNAVAGSGTQLVSVNFTSDDGNAATQFVLTTDLTALPAGWTSAASALTCAVVATGSGSHVRTDERRQRHADAGLLLYRRLGRCEDRSDRHPLFHDVGQHRHRHRGAGRSGDRDSKDRRPVSPGDIHHR